MKRFFFTILTAAVFAAVANVACDKPESKQTSGQEPEQPGQEPEPEQGVDVSFAVYSSSPIDYNNPPEWRWVVFNYSYTDIGKLLVINDEETLKTYTAGDYPAVDFSKKTLLLAYGMELGSQRDPDYARLQQFPNMRYKITVNINPGTPLLPTITNWHIALLVDKLDAESDVELEITRGGTEPFEQSL
jgi:hypothetical protein